MGDEKRFHFNRAKEPVDEPKPVVEPKVEEPKVEPKSTEPVEPVADPKPVEPTEPEEGTVEWYKAQHEAQVAQNKKLQEQVDKLAGSPQEPAAPEPEPEPVEDVVFVDQDKYDEVMAGPEGLNKLLNEVYQKGQQSVLRKVPDIVTTQVGDQLTVRDMVNGFYGSNPDLVGVKRFVQQVVNDLLPQNENDLQKVMPKLAGEVRERLGMPKPAAGSPKPKNGDPAVDPQAVAFAPVPVAAPAAPAGPQTGFGGQWNKFKNNLDNK